MDESSSIEALRRMVAENHLARHRAKREEDHIRNVAHEYDESLDARIEAARKKAQSGGDEQEYLDLIRQRGHLHAALGMS